MSDSTNLHFDVIIAGGGFAGVYCGQQLAKELGSPARNRVALIANENFMVFQPMLAEVVGSALAPRHVVNPLRLLCRGITVLRANITKIDLDANRVQLDAGGYSGPVSATFEHLALTLGGVVDLSRVPGMPEHAFLMKNVGDALRLRAAILDRFEEANVVEDAEKRKRLVTFVVVGGGYSGVETAGQILDLVLEIVRFYPRISARELRVALLHGGPHLLPEISDSLGRYTEENLRARGVEIRLDTRVTAITANRVTFGKNEMIETATVVSTVGNAPHPLVDEICHNQSITSEKGRIITDEFLRAIGKDRLWAAGDCAAVPMPEKRGTMKERLGPSPFKPQPMCPPTAQFAVRQGAVLGKNIARALRGEKVLAPFRFRGLGELAAIGHHSAVAEILGCKFHGFIAWWMWRTVYLLKLPGLERKLRVVIDWTLDLFFPRDMTLFQPRPTE
ncbi:MAG TPA: FAD-dependent oxidoreductase, partial [Chthoniobacteraceae bacterium]